MILNMVDQPERIRELIDFIEIEHHALEEKELFPLIHDQPFLSKGGPMCSHFMGLRLDFDYESQDRALLDLFYTKTTFRPKPHQVPSWLNPQSPLSIPIGEHILGAEQAACILFLLDQVESDLYKEFFERLCYSYRRLNRQHANKEDNCLFVMIEQNLP